MLILSLATSVGRFAHHKIVQAYCYLLSFYGTNSTLTNHCVVKMLHRIAWDCKMPGMMFQASVFKTFQKIMNDPRSKSDPPIKVRWCCRKLNDLFVKLRRVICLYLI